MHRHCSCPDRHHRLIEPTNQPPPTRSAKLIDNSAKWRARKDSNLRPQIVDAGAGESVDPIDMDAALPPLSPNDQPEREPAHLSGGTLTLEDLGVTTPNRLHSLITAPANPDRSAATYAAACEMERQGFSDDQVAAIILNPVYPISGHCLDQPSPQTRRGKGDQRRQSCRGHGAGGTGRRGRDP